MRLTCPGCGKTLETDGLMAGARDVCPSCGATVGVPPAPPACLPPPPPPKPHLATAPAGGGKNAALIAVLCAFALLVTLALLALLLHKPQGAAESPPAEEAEAGDELGGGGAEAPDEGLTEDRQDGGEQMHPGNDAETEVGEEPVTQATEEWTTNGPPAEANNTFVLMGSKPPIDSTESAADDQLARPAGASGDDGERLGTGDVSFRIYWSPKQDDIDLHVQDPNGHNLSYRKARCSCLGILDRDDRANGGPENIYWPTGCGPSGVYRYHATYFEGSGPKRVSVEVRRAGEVIEKRDFVLVKKGDSSETFVFEHRMPGREPAAE